MNTTVQDLNRLLALHGSSLAIYLDSASPYRHPGDAKAWEVIQHIIDDQRLMIDKIADYIENEDGTPDMGEFPAEFTGFHDLSLDYVMQQVLTRMQRHVTIIQQIADRLPAGTPAKALALEALGAAKGHVQSLDETLHSTASP